MSDNYRLYQEKVREQRAGSRRRLQPQLLELLGVVARCEALWALEDRVERGL
jgi:hypothetical protein